VRRVLGLPLALSCGGDRASCGTTGHTTPPVDAGHSATRAALAHLGAARARGATRPNKRAVTSGQPRAP
jgi:hypothetical protein